jgi:hypothetical protein
MTPFPERPNGDSDQDDVAELQKEEAVEEEVLDTLDRTNLSAQGREQLEETLEQVKQGERTLFAEATEEGIRRALARTDLTPEDRQQFEQALERLKQRPSE